MIKYHIDSFTYTNKAQINGIAAVNFRQKRRIKLEPTTGFNNLNSWGKSLLVDLYGINMSNGMIYHSTIQTVTPIEYIANYYL